MKRRVALLGMLSLLGLAASRPAYAEDEGFKLIHVADLDKLMSDKSSGVHVFDANHDAFRQKNGVIPGAKLLPSFRYDAARELPAEKGAKLVFYCADTR